MQMWASSQQQPTGGQPPYEALANVGRWAFACPTHPKKTSIKPTVATTAIRFRLDMRQLLLTEKREEKHPLETSFQFPGSLGHACRFTAPRKSTPGLS
jgi:hypothetical protein